MPTKTTTTIAAILTTFTVASLAQPKATPKLPDLPPINQASLAKMKVEDLYKNLCAPCHGADLNGGLAPSFLDGVWKHGSTDAEIARTILKGNLSLGMTPWEGILSPDQIRSLIIFLREKEKEAKVKGIQYPKPEPGKITRTELENYRIETVAEGLEIPWSLAFLPDGRKLVTERPGRLRVISRTNQLAPKPVADTPSVVVHGQGGLLDVVVHPNFASNGWIYLAIADGSKKQVPGKKKPEVNALTAIVRGRIKNNHWIDSEWIWRGDRKFYDGSGAHFGSRITFDRNGYLYFIVGERGALMEVQDLANPKGKIFRLHDDGRIPEDNPSFAGADAIPGIYSYGHRNPQGLARHPATGEIFSTEHGPRGGDELNRIQAGRNYGWPVITMGMNYNGTPLGKTHQAGMEQPLHFWVPSIATCGLDFYSGDRFPNWNNDLFVGALKQQEVRRLRLTNGAVSQEEVILKGLGRVRDVRTGPDGFLYVVLNKPGSILRLIPAR